MPPPVIPSGDASKPSQAQLARTGSAPQPKAGSRRYGAAKTQSQFSRCRRAEWKLAPTCLDMLFRKISGIFSNPPPKASPAALADPLRRATADMAAKLRDGDPASLAAAIRNAGQAARQFTEAGGDAQREILHCIRSLTHNHRGIAGPDDLPAKDACRKPRLEALAAALDSGTVRGAIARIEPDDAASLELLSRFESLVQREMVDAMYRSIKSAVDFTARTVRDGRPSFAAATALRFALDSARPVIRQHILLDNEQTALMIAGKIHQVLRGHRANRQLAVLGHMESADLRRLAQVGDRQWKNLVQQAIRARCEQLAQRFGDAANRLDAQQSECSQYFADLLPAGRAWRELENHRNLHGLAMPPAALVAKQRLQQSLAALPYPEIDLMALAGQDLAEAVAVTKTMAESAGSNQVGDLAAQLAHCQYRQVSESLDVALFSARYLERDFQTLLDSLDALERNLRPLMGDGPDEPLTRLAWIQSQLKIAEDRYGRLDTEDRPLALAPLMPLLNGFRQAAVAANEAGRPELAQRYEDMALILDALRRLRADSSTEQRPASESATDAAGRTDLTPAEYDRLFAVDVSNPGRPELHVGDVDPRTMSVIQNRLDLFGTLDDEQTDRQLDGGLVVSGVFYRDGMANAVPCRLIGPEGGAGAPLLDGGGWDKLTKGQRTSRLAAGYRKLIDFCDGDEAQARRLSLFVGKAIPDVLERVCYTADGSGPFYLPGGEWGEWLGSTKPSRQSVVLDLSKSEESHVRIRVELLREGGGVYVGNEAHKLTPDSYTRIAIEAELREDGPPLLTAVPAYRFYLHRDPSASPAARAARRRGADGQPAFAPASR